MSLFVFLHGGIQGSWVWEATHAALRMQDPDSRYLLLDVPGCGSKRDRQTEGMAFDDIVTDLVSDLEAAAVSDAVLVGHSQAGTVLPRLVEAAPDRFRKLIYVSCIAPVPGQTSLVGTAGRRMSEHEVEQREVQMERLRGMFCNDMNDAQVESFMRVLGQDGWPLSSYSETNWRYDHLGNVPSTYILLLEDMALSPNQQREFAARFRADRIVSIDAGHQAMITRPHALAELLLLETAGCSRETGWA